MCLVAMQHLSPQVSHDGRFFWNGWEWAPLHPTTGPSSGPVDTANRQRAYSPIEPSLRSNRLLAVPPGDSRGAEAQAQPSVEPSPPPEIPDQKRAPRISEIVKLSGAFSTATKEYFAERAAWRATHFENLRRFVETNSKPGCATEKNLRIAIIRTVVVALSYQAGPIFHVRLKKELELLYRYARNVEFQNFVEPTEWVNRGVFDNIASFLNSDSVEITVQMNDFETPESRGVYCKCAIPNKGVFKCAICSTTDFVSADKVIEHAITHHAEEYLKKYGCDSQSISPWGTLETSTRTLLLAAYNKYAGQSDATLELLQDGSVQAKRAIQPGAATRKVISVLNSRSLLSVKEADDSLRRLSAAKDRILQRVRSLLVPLCSDHFIDQSDIYSPKIASRVPPATSADKANAAVILHDIGVSTPTLTLLFISNIRQGERVTTKIRESEYQQTDDNRNSIDPPLNLSSTMYPCGLEQPNTEQYAPKRDDSGGSPIKKYRYQIADPQPSCSTFSNSSGSTYSYTDHSDSGHRNSTAPRHEVETDYWHSSSNASSSRSNPSSSGSKP